MKHEWFQALPIAANTLVCMRCRCRVSLRYIASDVNGFLPCLDSRVVWC